jgi:hypothetical protein
MKNIYVGIAIAAIFAMPAKADETLKFRIIGHPTSVQSQEVGDVDGHAFVVARLSGLASFPDGSVAPVYWAVQADYVKSVGPWLAIVNVTFGVARFFGIRRQERINPMAHMLDRLALWAAREDLRVRKVTAP